MALYFFCPDVSRGRSPIGHSFYASFIQNDEIHILGKENGKASGQEKKRKDGVCGSGEVIIPLWVTVWSASEQPYISMLNASPSAKVESCRKETTHPYGVPY